ncbi:hypothetical protein E1298_22240 [Actinomadura rubrisoli]|uniref:Histidine phosphatase family protein n=1 Tax=Actinomadura rubrisoli TaxID=2530368 RepID=A0A4V2YVU5_9ACTN|nr:hypothetical protein E1298_22240 [Actinomadura rubrisoli]
MRDHREQVMDTHPAGTPLHRPAPVTAAPGTELLLVRHAEAWCNVAGVVGGAVGCRGLTPLGRAQAAALAGRLRTLSEAGQGIDCFVASPRRRAAETAAIVQEAVGVPAVHDEMCAIVRIGCPRLEPSPGTTSCGGSPRPCRRWSARQAGGDASWSPTARPSTPSTMCSGACRSDGRPRSAWRWATRA